MDMCDAIWTHAVCFFLHFSTPFHTFGFGISTPLGFQHPLCRPPPQQKQRQRQDSAQDQDSAHAPSHQVLKGSGSIREALGGSIVRELEAVRGLRTALLFPDQGVGLIEYIFLTRQEKRKRRRDQARQYTRRADKTATRQDEDKTRHHKTRPTQDKQDKGTDEGQRQLLVQEQGQRQRQLQRQKRRHKNKDKDEGQKAKDKDTWQTDIPKYLKPKP
jgi:hypothetical protein